MVPPFLFGMRNVLTKTLCVLLFFIQYSIGANAYDFIFNILSEEDRTCEVSFFYDDSGSYTGYVIVPELYQNYTVVGIGDRAFFECNLDGISLPPTIKRIGEEAFWGCKGISSLRIPEQIEYIGDYAFYCSDLGGSVYIPNCCKYIGECSFFETNITELEFEGLFAIFNYDFCKIGYGAFGNCDNLLYVNLKSLCYNFSANPFLRCDNLKEIEGWGVYTNSEGTTGNLIENGCLYKFSEKEDTTCLELICCPAGKNEFIIPAPTADGKVQVLTTIGYAAFGGCEKITNIDIPLTVTKIRDYALFLSADSEDFTYRRVSIPESVDEMGYDIFGWFGHNWDIYIHGTKIRDIRYSTLSDKKYGIIHIPYGTKTTFNIEHVERVFEVIDDIEDGNFATEIKDQNSNEFMEAIYNLCGIKNTSSSTTSIYIVKKKGRIGKKFFKK